ncbi:MAG: STAS domain-containing protein [Leptonema sp. (in: Bacteria)]|nr:STAS domain-containing protein [Leptonema sp. (in: bacteria)]
MNQPPEYQSDTLIIRYDDPVWKIQPLTRLDLTYSEDFLKEATNFLTNKPANTIIDLSLVPYMSSSGVKSILNLQQLLRPHRYQVILCNLTSTVQKLVELSELVHVFIIAEDYNKARQKADSI